MVRTSGSGISAGAASLPGAFIVARGRLAVTISSPYNFIVGKSLRIDGERLRSLRIERALTLRDLGKVSGVSHNTINKLELGQRLAHASTVRKLAEALSVEPRELMKGER